MAKYNPSPDAKYYLFVCMVIYELAMLNNRYNIMEIISNLIEIALVPFLL